MKTKSFKTIFALIAAGTFSIHQIHGQTTGLSGTASNFQGAGTLGTDNTNLGAAAGTSTTAGASQNVMVGRRAGYNTTQEDNNTFIGFNSGYNNGLGAAGEYAGRENTFVGSLSGYSHQNIGNCTNIGYAAGYSNVSGAANTCVGHNAGYFNTTALNTFIGTASGFYNGSGPNNTYLGVTTGYFNATGANNTIAGYEAGYGVTGNNFSFNSIFGYRAGYNVTTGGYNVFMGDVAGFSNSSGTRNAFLGSSSGVNNTTGSDNVFVGYQAGNNNASGGSNIGIGSYAGYVNNSNTNNIAIGISALYYNTAFGNVGIGTTALYSNTSGNQNTAVGFQTLKNITTGVGGTAFGYQALVNTTGNYNTGYGRNALNNNTSGANNTCFGVNALYSTTGSNNTSIGYTAGTSNISGSNNTYVGYTANASNALLTNSTAIGNGAVVGTSNTMYLGNATLASVNIVAGAVYNGSDGRFKTNVTEVASGLEFIKKLRPVTYNINTENFDNYIIQNMPDSIKTLHKEGMDFVPSMAVVHSGFIAQEVELAAQAVGFASSIVHIPVDNSDYYSLSYSEFVVPLVKAVQELSKAADLTSIAIAKNDSINEAKMQAMQNKIDQLDAIINSCCTAGKSMPQNNSSSESLPNSKDVELSNKNIVVLDQNIPNPFADQTIINYFLPDNVVRAQIIFLDQAGKLIKAVDLKEKGKGSLNVFASDLTSGIYTYSLIVDGKTIETKRMVKTK